jgi:serine/threonine protein kinase/tetratricopeptide (TPR) repeat protein
MTTHSRDCRPLSSDGGPSTGADDLLMEDAARLAEALAASWRCGHCCTAEEMLADHPELRDHPRAALLVIYEEVCQRQELGQDVSLTELRQRFPRWADELAVALDCHRLLGLASRAPGYPDVGATLGEFRVLAQLGRGGRGRVYLAEETFLAGRAVVLKASPLDDREHLSLARLQHTHIVPLYSARDFPERGLRLLCMPCLGGATLEQLLGQLRDVPSERRSGRDLLEALRAGVAHPRLFWPAEGPNRRFLESASYVQAVCWMGAVLADALHYAHAQGLVHLDVKPSNVLLTADCQPMLLDFHLARGPAPAGGDGSGWLGGTYAYMSPEQKAAWRAWRDGRPADVAVDARSDVYSLGLLLTEALYGAPAATAAARAGELPPHPEVSTGLRHILARCLRLAPAERYPGAALLAEDLRRHLTHRPLVGVCDRSLAERWRKWRRRRPQALWLSLLVAACLAAVGAAAALSVRQAAQRRQDVQDSLERGLRHAEQRHWADAAAAFDGGLERLDGGPLHTELARQRRRAARGHDVEALHEWVQRTRYLHEDDQPSPEALRTLEAQCRTAWEQRDRLLAAVDAPLGPDLEEMVRRDLLDVAAIWSDCRVRLAGPAGADEARREALRTLEEAESLFGPSPLLSWERRALAGKPGGDDAGPAPSTAWEHYSLGRRLLRSGDLEAAAAAFDRAVELRPQDFWPWFGKGACAHRRGHYDQAVTAFTVCVALAPESAASWFNRGLAQAARADAASALRDYDRALQLDPRLAAAALNRGALRLQGRHFTEAEADFRLALELGANPAAAHYNRALLCEAREDHAAAHACLERALRHDPAHRPSLELRAWLRQRPLPAGRKPD